ncbi:MAG: transporter [Bradyrhizobium sp.]|nr:transporter [Bradyrhizobium sp.]
MPRSDFQIAVRRRQLDLAFDPGVIPAAGSYALPFYGCIGLELVAAVLIMIRGRHPTTSSRGAARASPGVSKDGSRHCARWFETREDALLTMRDQVSLARNSSSRSSLLVNIASVPSGLRGHSASGRSQYSSTPFSSGSRKYSASLTP